MPEIIKQKPEFEPRPSASKARTLSSQWTSFLAHSDLLLHWDEAGPHAGATGPKGTAAESEQP